jgi:hypothetical protein
MAQGRRTSEWITTAAAHGAFITGGLVAAGWTQVGATNLYKSPVATDQGTGIYLYCEVEVSGNYVNLTVGPNHDGTNVVAVSMNRGVDWTAIIASSGGLLMEGWFGKYWWFAQSAGGEIGNEDWSESFLGAGIIRQDSVGFYGPTFPFWIWGPGAKNVGGRLAWYWAVSTGTAMLTQTPSLDTASYLLTMLPASASGTSGLHDVQHKTLLVHEPIAIYGNNSLVPMGKFGELLFMYQGDWYQSGSSALISTGGYMKWNGRTWWNPGNPTWRKLGWSAWVPLDGFST